MAGENDWVLEELRTLALGDKRLEERARRVVGDMSRNPTASIPAFSGEWAATKGAYRLLEHEGVQAQAIVAAQQGATLRRMAGERLVLCLQDSTAIDLSGYESTAGRGALPRGRGKRQGFLAHTTLAVTAEGVPLGVLAQYTWVRSTPGAEKPDKRRRPIEEKESYKWLRSVQESLCAWPAGAGEAPRLLFVSDRESDVIEYFLQERPAEVHVLVRAAQDRRLLDSPQLLWATLDACPVAAMLEVALHKAEDHPLRIATCAVRFRQVTLAPPNSNRQGNAPKVPPVVMWAVAVSEQAPPPNVTPLDWRLLTSVPVTSAALAEQMVHFYALRWLVERFHYVLKSGCAIEQRRLGSVAALERLLALTNVVAWRLLWLTYLARRQPDLPCTVALSQEEWQALYLLVHRTPTLPDQPPTLYEATIAIARLGGFLARKGDGFPGPKVLWRGWQRLQDALQLFHAMQLDIPTYG